MPLLDEPHLDKPRELGMYGLEHAHKPKHEPEQGPKRKHKILRWTVRPSDFLV